jgi:di/tripeptidase
MTELSREVMRAVTGEEPVGKAASTDANIPLSQGVPANTLGAVRGALLHTRDEWVDSASVEDGMAVVMGIMLAQSEFSLG